MSSSKPWLIAAGVCLLAWLVGTARAGAPPPPEALLPELREEPLQTPTRMEPFSFDYRGHTYDVEPVADYVISALVMSRNDPTSFMDAYHDRDSVDTRDFCVVFGPNVDLDLTKVEVKNTSFFCWVRWERGVAFDMTALSNNHLITDSEAVRRQIADIEPGDQIRVNGWLVNYSPRENPSWVRRTSTTRDDDGGGACEVLFVDSLEVLARGDRLPYRMAAFGKWGLVAVVLAWVGSFLVSAARGTVRFTPRG